jgi:hypothetical protein
VDASLAPAGNSPRRLWSNLTADEPGAGGERAGVRKPSVETRLMLTLLDGERRLVPASVPLPQHYGASGASLADWTRSSAVASPPLPGGAELPAVGHMLPRSSTTGHVRRPSDTSTSTKYRRPQRQRRAAIYFSFRFTRRRSSSRSLMAGAATEQVFRVDRNVGRRALFARLPPAVAVAPATALDAPGG